MILYRITMARRGIMDDFDERLNKIHKRFEATVGKIVKLIEAEERPETKKLKLYVWDKYEPCYSDGIAFAIAHNEEEAWKLLELKSKSRNREDWGEVIEFEIKPICFERCGGG